MRRRRRSAFSETPLSLSLSLSHPLARSLTHSLLTAHYSLLSALCSLLSAHTHSLLLYFSLSRWSSTFLFSYFFPSVSLGLSASHGRPLYARRIVRVNPFQPSSSGVRSSPSSSIYAHTAASRNNACEAVRVCARMSLRPGRQT
jgi:hypothetical protein